jgi:hypothetical protein
MTSKTLEQSYSNLVLDSQFIELEWRQQQPNIFSALRIAHQEIRHSNFLGWLLDPKQTHGLGSKFLKLFLADVLKDNKVQLSGIFAQSNLGNATVLREWKNIDILIKLDRLVVTIENKVWSGEGNDQLRRYKEIVDSGFKSKNLVYVFLTPYGSDSSMQDSYVNYSYQRIIWILELTLKSYKEGISVAVLVYINDYLETLKSVFMTNSESSNLARQIYLNHKDLFDYIYNHTPNPIRELHEYFSSKLSSFGWTKGSSFKNFVRFLPTSVNDFIPRNGTSWNRESLLFEIKIQADQIDFYFTIGPGDEETRKILKDTFKTLQIVNELDTSEEYICYSWITKDMESIEFVSHDYQYLDVFFSDFFKQIQFNVQIAEQLLLENKDNIASSGN